MKKALVVLLILAVAGGLFAQTLSKTITADYETDLLYVRTDHTGDQKANLLTTSKFDSTELRLRIDYKGDYFTSFIVLKGDSLIGRGQTTVTSPNEGSGSFSAGNARPIDLLYQTFSDYELKGTVGMWTAVIGNQASRGLTDRFQQGFDDFLGIKHDNYGIFAFTGIALPAYQPVPGATNTYSIQAKPDYFDAPGQEVNNFAQKAPHGYTTAPWFGVFADLKDYVPITVAVAGSLNDPEKGSQGNDFYHKANAAIRVSGNKIADLVTFDVIYKYWSYGGQTVSQKLSGNDTFVEDTSTHSFGIYANLFVLDGLGIGLGYSGFLRTAEDGIDNDPAAPADSTAKTSFPFYSGIDLRVKYSALDPFTFTLNNNISFASAEGSKSDTVYGFKGTYTPAAGPNPATFALDNLNEKESESYFALYNALAVEYKVSDTLTVKFLLGNELISYSYENADDATGSVTGIAGSTVDVLRDVLQTALMASFAVHPNVTFRAGLDLKNTYTTVDGSTEITGASWESTKYSILEFGIPIGVKIVF